MEQIYGICRVSIAPLRAEPSDKAEISSQLLFGDHVEVIETTEKWWRVRAAYDGYEGWMDYRQLAALTLAQYIKNHNSNHVVPLESGATLLAEDGSKHHLSPGSTIPLYEDRFCHLGAEQFEVLFEPFLVEPFFKSDSTEPREGWMPVEPSSEVAQGILETALFFQNAPYLWGGRSLYGIDCSGFSQIVYKMNGIRLNRDAWQQAEQGEELPGLAGAKAGDLAFFDNEAGKITHVGILLENQEIIHASGKVRIDKIDEKGIYNAELDKYSHQLKTIRRYF